MTLQQIFERSQKKDTLVLHLQGEFKNDLLARSEKPNSIEDGEIEILKNLLSDNHGKWVAASFLEIIERLPEELLDPLLWTALNTEDPGYNAFFIEPCLRIFGEIKVVERLHKFLEDDFGNASGILRSLYHINSRVRSVGRFLGSGNEINFKTLGFNYEWDAASKKYLLPVHKKDKAISEKALQQYLPTHEQLVQRKKDLIINIRNRTSDKDLIEIADEYLEKQ